MLSVNGVLETALYVDDLKRSAEFYKSVFGFETLQFDDRLRVLSVEGRQVLLLFKKGASAKSFEMPGGTIPSTDGDGNLHLAFSISAAEIESWESWLLENGVAIESKVKWDLGGTSLYFRDPDDHVIELATPGVWSIY